MIQLLKNRLTESYVIFFNLEKVYDRVDIDFLLINVRNGG